MAQLQNHDASQWPRKKVLGVTNMMITTEFFPCGKKSTLALILKIVFITEMYLKRKY